MQADVGIVKVRVQHDNGVGEHKDCVSVRHLHSQLLKSQALLS